MKAKDIVTLVLLLVGIAVVYSVFKRSGLDRALVGATGWGGDVMAGPLTGSGPGAGPGSFGVTSSPTANGVGIVQAGVPVPPPSAPLSGATAPSVASGTIGPSVVVDRNTVFIPGIGPIGLGGGTFAGRPEEFLRASETEIRRRTGATPGGAPGGGLYFGPGNVNAPAAVRAATSPAPTFMGQRIDPTQLLPAAVYDANRRDANEARLDRLNAQADREIAARFGRV